MTALQMALESAVATGVMPSPDGKPRYMGWVDSDRKKPARRKLAEALDRFSEKFPLVTPTVCLCGQIDAEELLAPARGFPADLPVEVHGRGYISRWVLYIGTDAS